MLNSSDFVALRCAQIDWQDSTPVASAFADPYFSRDNGVAETDHVFIAGNLLPARFAALGQGSHFVIGETGFGSGLNFQRAAACFLAQAPESCVLHFISSEQYPLTSADLQRAAAALPAAPVMDELRQRWPAPAPGFHQRSLANGRIRLTLLFGDSARMLNHFCGQADAWFLDGFAPARNSSMWHPALYTALRRCSAPGATLATFTAAGHVRRGLTEAGFAIERVAGYGRKRHMLRGTLSETVSPDLGSGKAAMPRPRIAVVGAGLAGCTSARALAEAGCPVQVLDLAGIAQGASGNLAGVLYSSASAHMTAQNRFYLSSYLHALDWLARLGFPCAANHGALSGVIQLAKDERARHKAETALASGIWPDSELTAVADTDGALHFLRAGYLSPAAWCSHLLNHPLISVQQSRVEQLARVDNGWQLLGGEGQLLASADQVLLANAAAALALANISLPLKSIRGQVSYVAATEASTRWQQALCHHGYLTPALAGWHCVGATFDQHDNDDCARDGDDQRNLEQLRHALPEHWQALGGDQAQVLGHRVGFRCQSNDFLPIVGPLPEQPGLFLNIAHGSRGLTGTPLCADLLCAQMLGWPLPVDGGIAAALAPARFARRQQKNQASQNGAG